MFNAIPRALPVKDSARCGAGLPGSQCTTACVIVHIRIPCSQARSSDDSPAARLDRPRMMLERFASGTHVLGIVCLYLYHNQNPRLFIQ